MPRKASFCQCGPRALQKSPIPSPATCSALYRPILSCHLLLLLLLHSQSFPGCPGSRYSCWTGILYGEILIFCIVSSCLFFFFPLNFSYLWLVGRSHHIGWKIRQMKNGFHVEEIAPSTKCLLGTHKDLSSALQILHEGSHRSSLLWGFQHW